MPTSALNPETPTRAPACVGTQNGTRRAPRNQPERIHPTPRIRPENLGNEQTNEHLKKARLRANICITSQNVNGAAAPSLNMNYREKWRTISDVIHAEKTAIFAIQESHLDQPMTEQLGRNYEKNLTILNSAHPDNPRAMAGVSFVINKQLIEPDEIEMHDLIPGRAAMLKIKWLKSCTATILNVYAPNERGEHASFWAKVLTERRAKHLPIPDFTLGDFNVTEDAIDRMPPKLNDESAINALREVKQVLRSTCFAPLIFPNYPPCFPFTSPMFHLFIYQIPRTAILVIATTFKTLITFAFIPFLLHDSIPSTQ